MVVTALLGPGCVHADRATLVTSTASLACDWGYTRAAASAGWMERYEANPVLGPTPSEHAVDKYFAATIALNTMLWLATPTKYRWIGATVVTVPQAKAIYGNSSTVGGFCGL